MIADDHDSPPPPPNGLPGMCRFWEVTAEKERLEAEKCQRMHRMQRPYGEKMDQHKPRSQQVFADFPRWRSNDAWSASLVASAPTSEIIPLDSRVPSHRYTKLLEKEAIAEETRRAIQADAAIFRPARARTRLSTEDFSDRSVSSSYDDDRAPPALVESIGDTRTTRDFFERASRAVDFENQLIPRPFAMQTTPVTAAVSLKSLPANYSLSVRCGGGDDEQLPSPPSSTGGNSKSRHASPLSTNHLLQQQRSSHTLGIPTTPAMTSAYPAVVVSNRQSFLEMEIAKQRERDNEHQVLQQQLGHPTLEDTFKLWGVGSMWEATMTRQSSNGGHRDGDVTSSFISN